MGYGQNAPSWDPINLNLHDGKILTTVINKPGVLRFGLDEDVPFKPQNTYPYSRVNLEGTGTVF